MKACPICLGKYFDDMDICSECGVKLIDHKIAKQIHDNGGAENYLDKYPDVALSVLEYKKKQEKRNQCAKPSTVNISARSMPTKQQSPAEVNIPKCPTCGSTNVNKISATKKALGFITVGVFSSNLGKTMECKNCGYKW